MANETLHSYLSHVLRKPDYAICEQQRRRSIVRCLDSIKPLVSISEIFSLYLASMAAQTGLCLTWSQIPKTGFLVTWLILCMLFGRYRTLLLGLPPKTLGSYTKHVILLAQLNERSVSKSESDQGNAKKVRS